MYALFETMNIITDDCNSKKKIGDFLSLLAGFEASTKLIDSFATHCDSCNSKILRRLLTLATKGGKSPGLLP